MHGALRWVFLASVLSLGCGDDASTTGGSGGQGGSGGGGAGGAPACPDGTLCLDVQHDGPAAGRLALVWFRELPTGSLTDPAVGFEEAFDETAAELTIDLASVSPPPDALLLCERPCEMPAECACEPGFSAGVGFVLVVQDEDLDGAVSPADLANEANIVGIANVAMIYAPEAFTPAPAPFDETFPEGVKAGIEPYRINEQGAYQPSSAARFTLKVGPDAF